MPSIHPMDEAEVIDAEANRLETELDQTARVLGQANDTLSKVLKENEELRSERAKYHGKAAVLYLENDRLRAALAEADRDAVSVLDWREHHGWTGYFDDGATNDDDPAAVDAAIDAFLECQP